MANLRNGMQFLCALLLLGGALISPARAQSFGPPVPTEMVLALLDREGNVRFTLSSYYAHWQNPFQVTVAGRTIRLFAATPSSPLFEGNYVLSRRWSVGFWYNPIRGERIQGDLQVGQKFAYVDVGRDTDLADLHVIYYGPHGLSAQLGYYHESGTYAIRDLNSQVTSRKDYALVSWNLWLTQRLDVFTRDRLTNDRLYAHLIPFVSMGYHASSGLNHAVSLLTGVAITFRDRISLSGSVWLFDLSNTATRITGGLVIQF